MTPLQLVEQVEEDLRVSTFRVFLLTEIADIEDIDLVSNHFVSLLFDVHKQLDRTKKNADELWQMLRERLQAEDASNGNGNKTYGPQDMHTTKSKAL
jgi:hypothetical protein